MVAALRGGWELVLKTILYGMYQREQIELVVIVPDDLELPESDSAAHSTKFQGRTKGSRFVRRTKDATPPVEPLEAVVWEFLQTKRQPDEFFKDAGLRSVFETYAGKAQQDFERKGLLATPVQHNRAKWIGRIISFLVLGIGVSKLCLGLIHNKPSEYLIVMILLAALSLYFSVIRCSQERLSPAGRQFMNRLEAHFAWLKEAIKGERKPGIDPAYAFALFGTTILAGTLLFSSFSEAFPGRTIGGCGGGACGGGIGDGGGNSDSSGSGSDGGSSGCGGCGGGGCGGGGGD
jgi:uncharacterized protein (TIGR04222 family)